MCQHILENCRLCSRRDEAGTQCDRGHSVAWIHVRVNPARAYSSPAEGQCFQDGNVHQYGIDGHLPGKEFSHIAFPCRRIKLNKTAPWFVNIPFLVLDALDFAVSASSLDVVVAFFAHHSICSQDSCAEAGRELPGFLRSSSREISRRLRQKRKQGRHRRSGVPESGGWEGHSFYFG